MPKELKEINSCGGLFEPETVAECLIYNLSRGNYHTCIGLEGWMLGVLSAGGAPEKSFLQAAAQVILSLLICLLVLNILGISKKSSEFDGNSCCDFLIFFFLDSLVSYIS